MKCCMVLVLVLMVVSSVHAHGGIIVENSAVLCESDFITTGPSRISLLTDVNIRRDVKNLIDEAHSALKYDENGCARIGSDQSNISELKKTESMVQFKLNTQKRPRPLIVRRSGADLEIAESEDAKDTGSLNIGLTNGRLFSVMKKMDDESWLIIRYDPIDNKFHEEIKTYRYISAPELNNNIIWPELPSEITIDSKVAPEVVERLNGAYKLVLSILDEVRRGQAEAKYSPSGKVRYGKLPGRDDVEGFSFKIWNNRLKSITANYKTGKSVDVQFEPFIINVLETDKSFLKMRIGDDGKVKSYALR